MTAPTIPDTIEPYVGYKALVIRDDGQLESPSYTAIWPAREPLQASCNNNSQEYGWETVPLPENWEPNLFWVPSKFLQEGATTRFQWPTKPPPPNHTYLPVPIPHQLKPCKCGIYVAATATGAQHYLAGHNRVLCEIALWGQVVPATDGARGQYAYPQKMYCATQQADLVAPVADRYGIPLETVNLHHHFQQR